MIWALVIANVFLTLLSFAGLFFCFKARASATAFLLMGGCIGFVLLQVGWFMEVPFSSAIPLWQELPRVSVWFCFLIATLRFGRNLSHVKRFTQSNRVHKI
jgi:hypothetical protein